MTLEKTAPQCALLFVVVLLLGLGLTGCGSSSSQMSTPPVNVTVTAKSQSIFGGQTTALTAATNDPKGVTWSLSGPGSLSSMTATSVTYNAPAANATTQTATVIATSVSNPSETATTKITIAPAITVSVSSNTTSIQAGQTATLTATTDDPKGVTWSLSGAGSLTSSSATSVTYTAPATISGAFSATVTATSVSQSTTSSSVAIRVIPASLAVLTSSLPNVDVGESYNQNLNITGGTPPYTFSISSGALPPGLSLTNSPAITGTPTAAGVYNFTFQVTDFAIPPNVATANLAITAFPALTLTTTTLPGATAALPYAATPAQASGGSPPYMYSAGIDPGFTTDGISMNPVTGQAAGIPEESGTLSFPVSVSDSVGGKTTANLSLNVAAENCPNNSNFTGNYAFQFNGPAWSPGPNSIISGQEIGSFLADGAGNISQGYMDNGGITQTGITGTYCVGADNVGSLTFVISDTQLPLLITVSSVNASAILYQEIPPDVFINPATFGTILKQDTTAFSTSKVVGNYVFGFYGFSSFFPEVETGTFSSDGAGNLTGEIDRNGADGPTNAMFGATNFAVAPFGRGTATLNEPGGGTVSLVFYIVNASQLFALAMPSTPSAITTGPIVQSVGGPYANGSLSGVSVIGLQSALESHTGQDNPTIAQAGLITWDGAGNFSLSADENRNGTLSTPSYTGTYSVASNGRVTLNVTGQSTTPIIYLSAPNQGFIVGTDENVTGGQIMAQSGSSFGVAFFSGAYLGQILPTYLEWPLVGAAVDFELDEFSADGAGNLTGTSYLDNLVNGPNPISANGTYTISSTGRGVVTQNGSTTGIFYVVSPTQVLMIPATGDYPKVITLSTQ